MKRCNDLKLARFWQSLTIFIALFALLGIHTDIVKADACPTMLLISEYVESGSNKAIELYNGTGADIDLAGYTLARYANGRTAATATYDFSGTLADGDTFIITHPNADAALVSISDVTDIVVEFNGNDAMVLTYNSIVVDSIGQVGNDAYWGADVTLVRKSSVFVGDTIEDDAFTTAEWDSYPADTFTYLGDHIMDNCSGNGANNLSITKDATPTVNVELNDLVTYTVVLSNSSAISDTYTLLTDTLPTEVDFAYWITQPANSHVANDEVTWQGTVTHSQKITVTFAVTNLVRGIPVENTAEFSATATGSDSATYIAALACDMTVATTCIHLIQGDSDAPNMRGDSVTIEGIVVGVMPDLDGFYVQEEDSDTDDDPATSEGIFVYLNAAPLTVSVGDKVQVTGAVDENYNNTQLDNDNGDLAVITVGTAPLPTAAAVTLPFVTSDYPERFEGMRIRNTQPLSVTEVYGLKRYGQVLLSAGRLMQGTQAALPGAPALAVEAANALNQIVLDDGSNTQNPDVVIHPSPELSATNTLRGGDVVTNILGVLHYSYDAYRIHPTNTPDYIHSNPRPTTLPQMPGTLKVASFNVLNYFDTFSGCTGGVGGASMDCRGANDATEFTRQRDKIIAAMLAIDADIFGLMEIENDGYANEASAIDDLVDGLNAIAGAGTYAYNDVDAATGTTNALGTDAIKVDMIYKPATVILTGTTFALDYQDNKNRVSLIQSFQDQASGEVFTVIVNHLKSKGSSCDSIGDPDTGDGQGNCNLTRTAAANTLINTLATDPTGVNDPDYLIIGDLNSYGKEDPITTLEAAGYTDMVEHFGDVYGYVFYGRWGTLDYAMANATLIPQISNTIAWHINADEPIGLDYNIEYKSPEHLVSLYQSDMYRASDHDPVIVSLNFGPNSAPVAANDVYTTSENVPLHITAPGVLDNDGDADNHTLTAMLDTAPTHGALTLKLDGSFIYTPTADYNGQDTFTYHANDGQADSNIATVTLTITASVNTAPTISDIANQVTIINTPLSVTFSISDTTDPVADLQVYAASSNVTLVNDAPTENGVHIGCGDTLCTLWITPTTGITGTAIITVTVDDGTTTASDDFMLTVTPVNGPPVFISTPTVTGTVGTPYTYNVTTTDPNDTEPLTLTAPTKPAWLTLNDNGDGTATLTGTPALIGEYAVALQVNNGTQTATQAFSITVSAAPPTYTLRVNIVGNGTVTPTSGVYVSGTLVLLEAAPAAEWEFVSWSGVTNATLNLARVLMDADKVVTATFSEIVTPPPTHTLTVNIVGNGTVSPTSGTYISGTVVTLTATPDSDWHFAGWSGAVIGIQNPISLVLDADQVVTATFSEIVTPPPTYTLSVNMVGSGTISPTGGSYVSGTIVSLEATPASGWAFVSWTGVQTATGPLAKVLVNADKVVTATFAPAAVCQPITDVAMSVLSTGAITTNTVVTFQASALPITATAPLTYTLNAGLARTTLSTTWTFTQTFTSTGVQTITLDVWNCALTVPVTATATVNIIAPPAQIWQTYLPLVVQKP